MSEAKKLRHKVAVRELAEAFRGKAALAVSRAENNQLRREMSETKSVSDYPQSDLVLQASERILKGYPEDWTDEKRDKQFSEDAAFCASWIQDMWASG